MQNIKSTHSLSQLLKAFNANKRFKKVIASSLTLSLLLGLSSVVSETVVVSAATGTKASTLLAKLPVKGRAPKTGYDRDLFSDGWGKIGECDARNFILRRDLKSITWRSSPRCTVSTGILNDPYTARKIYFVRGVSTSSAVQIDHVVAVSDAWQKGAQKLSFSKRYAFYNDPLNLLAVDGPSNQRKSDSDAASWLPPNRKYWCSYVSRQIAVKYKYKLWVTSAEKSSMSRVLKTCPNQLVPRG